jgi:hypothetical protein
MPGWIKVLLIIAIVVVLLVAGIIGGGAYFWYRNKDAIIAKTKALATEGEEFGRHSDNQGCVDESVSRYKKEPGFTSAISTSVFMRICLDASRPKRGFCDDVPKEMAFTKSAQWRIAQCRIVNLESDSYCPQLFAPVQQYCDRRVSTSSSNDNSSGH